MARTDTGNQHRFTRQKSERFSGGFTIIEVILFLAISGLLLAVAIASINANINNSRFNDAIRSTTSYLQGQYSEVAAGQSDRNESQGCDEATGDIDSTPTAAGMSNCVIMGRFIKLEGSTFTVRYITGHKSTLSDILADDTDAIMQMDPKVASETAYKAQYDVPWDIGVVSTELPSSTASASTGLAIIRSPASGNILYYTEENISSVEPLLNNVFINDLNLNRKVTICFADSGKSRVGRISIGGSGVGITRSQGQEIIQTDLANTGACPTP